MASGSTDTRTADAVELSAYGERSGTPSPVNRMMAEFAGDFRDGVDINLGVGYVNERTIPNAQIVEALAAVLKDRQRYRQPMNYGGPAGSDNLRTSLWRYLLEQRVGGLTEELLADREIIVGPNGATSLLESLAYVLPKGIVVTTDPMYYIYTNFLERAGFDLLAVPEDRDGIRVDLLESKLDELGKRASALRAFYLVTVGNPSCAILANDRRRAVIDMAIRLSERLGRKVPVIFDRAYEDLVHDPDTEAIRSGFHDDPAGVVYEIGTLSKVLAPALRIGYMIGRGGPFMDAMVQRTSDAGFSAPLMTQEMASWLLDHHIARQLDTVRRGYREKAVATRAWIDAQLGDEVETVIGGRAGFYLYLTFKQVRTEESSPFFRYLTRTTGNAAHDGPPDARHPRVIYIPGTYCVHRAGDLAEVGRRQLRISYGFEERDAMERAITIMRDAIDYARSV